MHPETLGNTPSAGPAGPDLPADLPAENIYAHTKKLRFIRRFIDLQRRAVGRPIALLDFGCGNGSAVSRFLMGEGIEYTGVDFHEPSLSYARAHFGSARARFLPEIPAGATFDVIVYADVIEHLDDPVGLLAAHRRVLRPGGLVIGSVPNGYGPFETEKRMVRWVRFDDLLAAKHEVMRAAVALRKRLWTKPADSLPPPPPPPPPAVPYNSDSGHVQFFTRAGLIRTLRRAGLRLTAFEHGSFVGAPHSNLYLLNGEAVIAWNARVADRLPYWMVSTWYFTARAAPGPARPEDVG